MGFVYGLVCLAGGFGMVVMARPRGGTSSGFLSNWVVGQTYVLAVLVAVVIGVALIIGALPALL